MDPLSVRDQYLAEMEPLPLSNDKNGGTPHELRPIADKVLLFVAEMRELGTNDPVWIDDLRRIELCALAVREWTMVLEMYRMK